MGQQIEDDLRDAVLAGGLHAHFQPIACLRTGGITGFEILCRWRHPKLGEIEPAFFIPMAERLDLIPMLGEWVLRRACEEAAGWQQPLKVSVNLSPYQMERTDIVSLIEEVLSDTGLDPNRLDLEVTENVMIENTDKTIETLRRLKGLGVRIAVDDFGTGYSSLGYFLHFPFDKVKIDQSFIRAITESREAYAIVKAVVALGSGLGMLIIAEGVETEEQAYLLSELGCDKLQGYLIGRPAPIEDYHHLVSDHRSGSHGCLGKCGACLELLRVPTTAAARYLSPAAKLRDLA